MNQPDALADFGLTPKKPKKVDPVTQVIAAAKNLATRTEHGALGKKERLAIRGLVSAADVAAKVAKAMAPPATPVAAPATRHSPPRGSSRLPRRPTPSCR